MISISNRSQDLGASPIRHLLPYARKAKAAGKKVYHLNIGQPDIKTPESALRRIKALDDPVVGYGPSEGLTALRSAVATYYDNFNADIDANHVMVTTGASEAILFTLLTACDNHSEVIIPEPFYANYLGFAHLCNVDIVPITCWLADAFKLPSPAEFEKKITPKTRAIFLCNPGNPTGQLYTRDELAVLVEIVRRHQLFLIVDEVYREFCYDDVFTSVLSFPEASEHVIVIDSISKVFSSCGARVGFLITKNEDILHAVNKYAQLRLCPPHYGQQLALGCYEDSWKYVNAAKHEYNKRRLIIHQLLSEIPGIESYLPVAAFYNIVSLPVDDAEKFCAWLLSDFEKDGATVMLAPAHGFYFNEHLGKDQVRIAYVLNENDIRNAVSCLAEGLKVYQGKMQLQAPL